MSNNIINEILFLACKEGKRQNNFISLIASENFIFPEALKVLSSPLINKYAEGYPGKRYYAGCRYIDQIETITIEEAKKTFNCQFANVQSLSGSIANFSVYKTLLNVGDTILAMDLQSGGHLTHSGSSSFVSSFYSVVKYSLDENNLINYEEIKKLAIKHKPKLIIAGCSSYTLQINFEIFREIANEVGAYLFGDISHLSGLIISKLHPNCFPFCDIVMTTIHKQLKGPRAAIILWNKAELTEKINKSVFPGTQGGPSPHVIAAIGICLSKCNEPEYHQYCKSALENNQTLYRELQKKGVVFCHNRVETFMSVINVKKTFGITGDLAQEWLEKIHICVNKNAIPGDANFQTPSGIRIGTLSATSQNLKAKDMVVLSEIIFECLNNYQNEKVIKNLKNEVLNLLKKSKNSNIF